MSPAELLEDLRLRGYTVSVRDGRLKLRGPCRPPAEVEKRIASCRDQLIAELAEPKIESEAQVFDLARQFFGPVEDPVIPPAPLGRDSMVKRGTDKAEFFTGDWRETYPRDFEVYEGGKS